MAAYANASVRSFRKNALVYLKCKNYKQSDKLHKNKWCLNAIIIFNFSIDLLDILQHKQMEQMNKF